MTKKNLERNQRKRTSPYRETKLRITMDFLSEAMQARSDI